MTKTKQWVTIAIRGDHGQALSAEKKLRKAGVPVRLLDDVNEPHEVAFHWAPKASLGGTAIQVDHRVVEEACEILGVSMPIDDEDAPKEEGDAESKGEVKRAFYIAVFGIFLCPGLAHLWSLAICANVWSRDLDEAARRLRHAVVCLDLLVLVVIGGVAWQQQYGHRDARLSDRELDELVKRPIRPAEGPGRNPLRP